jgi:hypothetical protein
MLCAASKSLTLFGGYGDDKLICRKTKVDDGT